MGESSLNMHSSWKIPLGLLLVFAIIALPSTLASLDNEKDNIIPEEGNAPVEFAKKSLRGLEGLVTVVKNGHHASNVQAESAVQVESAVKDTPNPDWNTPQVPVLRNSSPNVRYSNNSSPNVEYEIRPIETNGSPTAVNGTMKNPTGSADEPDSDKEEIEPPAVTEPVAEPATESCPYGLMQQPSCGDGIAAIKTEGKVLNNGEQCYTYSCPPPAKTEPVAEPATESCPVGLMQQPSCGDGIAAIKTEGEVLNNGEQCYTYSCPAVIEPVADTNDSTTTEPFVGRTCEADLHGCCPGTFTRNSCAPEKATATGTLCSNTGKANSCASATYDPKDSANTKKHTDTNDSSNKVSTVNNAGSSTVNNAGRSPIRDEGSSTIRDAGSSTIRDE